MAARTTAKQGLGANELFKGISAVALEPLVEVAELRTLNNQEALFQAGDRAAALFLIQEGAVSLELPAKNTRYVVDICGPSRLVGWSALRSNAHYTLSATTVRRGSAWVVQSDALHSVLMDEPELAVAIFRNLAETISTRWEALAREAIQEDVLSHGLDACPLWRVTHPAATPEEFEAMCLAKGKCLVLQSKECPVGRISEWDWYRARLRHAPTIG